MAWINFRGVASVFSERFPFALVQRVSHQRSIRSHQLGFSVEDRLAFVPYSSHHSLLTQSFLVTETLHRRWKQPSLLRQPCVPHKWVREHNLHIFPPYMGEESRGGAIPYVTAIFHVISFCSGALICTESNCSFQLTDEVRATRICSWKAQAQTESSNRKKKREKKKTPNYVS